MSWWTHFLEQIGVHKADPEPLRVAPTLPPVLAPAPVTPVAPVAELMPAPPAASPAPTVAPAAVASSAPPGQHPNVLAVARADPRWREYLLSQFLYQDALYDKLEGATANGWTDQQRVDRFFDPNKYPLQDPDDPTVIANRIAAAVPIPFQVWPSDDPIAQRFEAYWNSSDPRDQLPGNDGNRRPFTFGQMKAYQLSILVQGAYAKWLREHYNAIVHKYMGGVRVQMNRWVNYSDQESGIAPLIQGEVQRDLQANPLDVGGRAEG